MIAETDHVFMKPLPNLASPTEAAAHSFGYMHASPRHNSVVKLCWPEGDHTSLQPIGPSPVIIYLPNLKKVAQRWLGLGLGLGSGLGLGVGVGLGLGPGSGLRLRATSPASTREVVSIHWASSSASEGSHAP